MRSDIQPIGTQSSNNMVSLRANRVRRKCDVAQSAVLVLLLFPLLFSPLSGSSTCKRIALKQNLNPFPAEQTPTLLRASTSDFIRDTFLPNWSRIPPTSSEKVQPIPGLQTRVEGGKEVAGNRDGERRGCWRAWRTGRTGAGVRLCLV